MSMNSQTINPVSVTQSDRMSLTIFFALAIHAILILGISFDLMDNSNDVITTMEITLVHQRSNEEPEEADYLAQANQIGGGDQQEKSRPSSPFSNPLPTLEEGFAGDFRFVFLFFGGLETCHIHKRRCANTYKTDF